MRAHRYMRVETYDTTLRDGSQMEGISFSLRDKLFIAQKLDELGVDYIEGGYPGSNPKDAEFFRKVKKHPLKKSKTVAFGSTRRKNSAVDEDSSVKALLKAETDCVCVFGKSWDIHVTNVLVTDLKENLAMIRDTVSYLKSQGKEVIYDAEHFFDGFVNNYEYALETLKAAEEGGASRIVLCDTNGGMIPGRVREVVQKVIEKIGTPLGIHAHNDSGCAVANSIVAVEGGCVHVQGTINGFGERCGNADLTSIIPDLTLKLGIDCIDRENLPKLTEVSHFVSEVANITLNPHHPYVGHSAFAHKGGVHVSAVLRQKGAYEHIDPALVGNRQRFLVSEQAGTAAVIQKAKEVAEIDLSEKTDKVKEIIKKLKEKENVGYHYEVADGSFAIFILKNLGVYKPLFEVEGYKVSVERARSGRSTAEAIVKLFVNGERVIVVGEGKGPVNALDRALRKALEPHYPDLTKSRLTDFKVRILGETKGTAAATRVLIESTDGKKDWGTVGVSENIIEASWEALVDSIDYSLLAAPSKD